MVTEQYMMLQVVFKAKVSSVLKEKSYVWKPLRSNCLVSMQSKLPWWTLETQKDLFGFLPRGALMPAKKPRSKFRLRLSEVNWWKLIWFCTTIPRHSSSFGLLRKKKLHTWDKLLQWGYKVIICVLSAEVAQEVQTIYFLNAVCQKNYGRKL